jgi:hypothetical protein
MSVKISSIFKAVEDRHYYCDGPNHVGEKEITGSEIEVTHGYGSPYDMTRQDFCSIQCMADWANNPPSPQECQEIPWSTSLHRS